MRGARGSRGGELLPKSPPQVASPLEGWPNLLGLKFFGTLVLIHQGTLEIPSALADSVDGYPVLQFVMRDT
jgi:hypothetical protein